MKYKITLVCVLAAAAMNFAEGQNPVPGPTVAGCPSPIPNGSTNWPGSTCKYQFYPITDTTHAIASVSKTSPVYQHTYGSYKPTDLLVACPSGATTTAGLCTDATGKDISQLILKSAIPTFTFTAPGNSCPATFVPMNWTCTVDAAGKNATCTAPIVPAS